jgi:hypothetical protein
MLDQNSNVIRKSLLQKHGIYTVNPGDMNAISEQ